MIGRIHSVESLGTVDGPGIRFIVFTQGCPLRCLYCHNPDTWNRKDGKEVSVTELVEEIKQYLPYMKASNGGVTVSGGEPLLQPEFILELFKECKKLGITTALDTAGSVIPHNLDELLAVTDLVLLDVKHIDPEEHLSLTGMSNVNPRKFASLLNEKQIPVWIRHVLVPGYTDSEKSLRQLGDYIRSFTNVEKVDILPYHKMGEYKWEALGLTNQLTHITPPAQAEVDKAYQLIMNPNE